MNSWEPTLLVTIDGEGLAEEITQEVLSLVFEDNEEEADLLEITLANRDGQFIDSLLA